MSQSIHGARLKRRELDECHLKANLPQKGTMNRICDQSSTRNSDDKSRTFATERLQLAIFLHATRRMGFLGCQTARNRDRVSFLFDDPDNIGAQAELDFDQGAFAPAAGLFASQKFLRRRMSEATENRRNEKFHEYSERTASSNRTNSMCTWEVFGLPTENADDGKGN
jgi:hypothetical protein